jgi:zinc D-Ala-D-Ala dipeptidase
LSGGIRARQDEAVIAVRVLAVALGAALAASTAACVSATPPPAAGSPTAESPTAGQQRNMSSTAAAPGPPARDRSAARRVRQHAPSRRPVPVPPVSAAAGAAGFRDVRSIVPDAVIDLRYATPHNFVGVRLYPRDARCLVHRSTARGLAAAARRLRSHGNVLVFWDCYRPHAVQLRMFRVVSNPEWVARPGPYARSHEAGRSVDVTVARRRTGGGCPSGEWVQRHCLLVMGTRFDSFSPRAHAFATRGVSGRAQRNRAVLRSAMADGGLAPYSGEWWHFDGPGAAVHRPILHVPVD